jgi:hypothetical protein
MTSILSDIALAFARETMDCDRPVDRRYSERNRDPNGIPRHIPAPFDYQASGIVQTVLSNVTKRHLLTMRIDYWTPPWSCRAIAP